MAVLWRGYSTAAPRPPFDDCQDLFGGFEQFLTAAYEAFFSQRQAPGAIVLVHIQLTMLAAKAITNA